MSEISVLLRQSHGVVLQSNKHSVRQTIAICVCFCFANACYIKHRGVMQSACHKQKTALFQIVHVCTCIKYSRSAAELIYASAQLTFSIVWSLQGESIPDERSLAEEAAVPDISEADTSTVSTMNSATSSGARIMAATLLEDAKLEQSAKQAFETPSLSRQPAKQANEDTSFDQENPSESQKHECSRGWAGACPDKEWVAVLAILVVGALAIVACLWALVACYGFCCACMWVPWKCGLIMDSWWPSSAFLLRPK